MNWIFENLDKNWNDFRGVGYRAWSFAGQGYQMAWDYVERRA